MSYADKCLCACGTTYPWSTDSVRAYSVRVGPSSPGCVLYVRDHLPLGQLCFRTCMQATALARPRLNAVQMRTLCTSPGSYTSLASTSFRCTLCLSSHDKPFRCYRVLPSKHSPDMLYTVIRLVFSANFCIYIPKTDSQLLSELCSTRRCKLRAKARTRGKRTHGRPGPPRYHV